MGITITGKAAGANLDPRNIILIGLMGSGKTTVGQVLAAQLGWSFVDTDVCIALDASCDIPTLFARDGEPAFRDRETQTLRTVCAGAYQVIATGGGAVLREENRVLLRETAYVVWLTARPDVVVARVQQDGAANRPLLAGSSDLLVRILTLLGERGPLYQSVAHLVVDTSAPPRTPEAIAREIARKVEPPLFTRTQRDVGVEQ